MVSVAGHLVGTPLNVIAGRAALIRSNPTPEAITENVRRIEEQVDRLSQRIRRLVDYFDLAEPAVAKSGPPVVLIRAVPSGVATIVRLPFNRVAPSELRRIFCSDECPRARFAPGRPCGQSSVFF